MSSFVPLSVYDNKKLFLSVYSIDNFCFFSLQKRHLQKYVHENRPGLSTYCRYIASYYIIIIIVITYDCYFIL